MARPTLHTLAAWLLAPRLALSRRAGARALHRFAHAEAGSALMLRWAAAQTTDERRRALYLAHALDEERHTRMFARRADELWPGSAPLAVVQARGDDLFASRGEEWFLAFVHRAEGRGRLEFEGYAAAFERAGDGRTASVFRAIIADEERHESYSLDLLHELSGDRAPAALRRAARGEAWAWFRGAGRALTDRLYALLMGLLYLLVMPLLVPWLALTRPASPGRLRRPA
jgi:rubrerythrin